MPRSIRSIGILGLVAFVIAWSVNHYITCNCNTSPKDYVYHWFLQANVNKEHYKQQEQKSPAMVALTGVNSSRAAAQAAFRAVILGAPGSGKGTISARIVKQFDVNHISSGDKLRFHIANQTALGKEVKKYLDSGSLVPDETMISLISEEIKALEGRNWLLDGFPRTVLQAQILDSIHPISLVINLEVPDSIILERVKNRWTHLPSGRVYNIGFNDPKIPGKDDITGEPLCKRPDDQPEIVQRRLEEYVTKTKSVITYYKKRGLLHEFSGITTDELWPRIVQCIKPLIT